ncbi:TlyA family RNA methyltransferase [Acidovorax sp. LjRoot66]|uniref:TlyA family RNA methyltransferase n=1 Tax=Acidovorax sp. LjRoot66 TaxID=3342334 RepID=UPI003ECDAEC8
MRADVFLVESGHATTRSQAQRLIAAGVEWRLSPLSPWQKVGKNGDEIPSVAELRLLDDAEVKYISRGGLKLEGALKAVGLSVTGLRCLDVGQSTGGFTDCLLQQGAVQVIGVDVGQAQLHESLRSDVRVVCVEGLNARSVTAQTLKEACEQAISDPVGGAVADDVQPENPYRWMSGDGEVTDYDDSDDVSDDDIEADAAKGGTPADTEPTPRSGLRRRAGYDKVDTTPSFELIVGDLSFISLTLVLPALVPLLAPEGQLLMLVKPQFELQPGQVGKGGIVRDESLYAVVEQRIRDCCAGLGLTVQAWLDSPISGGDGNREFFVFARRAA